MRVEPVETLDDPRVADYRNVRDVDLRADAGLFMAEGRLTVKRLLCGSPYRARSVFVTPAGLEGLRDSLARLGDDVPVYLASQGVLNDVVGYDMHRGCLAAAERVPPDSFAQALASSSARPGPRLWVALEDVTNPDNMGGIFRNALAFGAERMLLAPRSVDPLYRKSIRVSMGAVLRLPFCRADDWSGALARLRAAGFRVVALDADRGATPLAELALSPELPGVALLIGNEGEGLSPVARDAADARVVIPMAPGIDSLNAATASGIALHQIASSLGRL